MTDQNMFRRGDRVVFIQDDHDGNYRMPQGTKAVYNDSAQPVRSNSVAHVTLEDGTEVVAWTDRLRHSTEPEKKSTERVVIRDTRELKVGDVVVRAESYTSHYAEVDRELPVPPKAPAPGHGSAIVANKRYKGFVSKMGAFYYLNDSGTQQTADEGTYADFHRD